MHKASNQPEPPQPEPSDLDRSMMARALQLAAAAGETGEVPVGAVVYETESGRVLGEGANTREHAKEPWGHAEFLAVQAACTAIGDWRLNHCTLAVTLEPCPMCAGLLVNARLGRVIYGAADPKAGAVNSLYELLTDERLNHRCEVISGVLAEESGELLRGFFRQLRGKNQGG
ncbi:MAG: tRNA(adenine34) deaminase [Phycisphaerales bacterium]